MGEPNKTWENVTVHNKPQRNFEAVRSGTGSMLLWIFDYFDGGHFENRSLAIYSLSIKR